MSIGSYPLLCRGQNAPGSHRHIVARLLSLVLLTLVSLCAPAALAAAKVPVVMLNFEGPGSTSIRKVALSVLRKHVALADRKAFVTGAPSLDSDADYAAGALAAEVNAIVEGRVEKEKGYFIVTVTVRGGDGAVIKEMTTKNRTIARLGNDVRRLLWRELGESIKGAPAPGAPEPAEPEEAATPRGTGNVVVLPFEGPGAEEARGAVVSALEGAGLEVSTAEASDAPARVGRAREANARAVIAGTVSRKGKGLVTALVVYDGQDGKRLGKQTIEGRSQKAMLTNIGKTVWSSVGSWVMQGEVPKAEPEEAADAVGGDVAEDEALAEDEPVEEAPGAVGPRPSPLTLGGYLSALNRNLSYDDLPATSSGALRDYNLPLGAAFELAATWYPAAHFTGGFAANLGLEVAFGQAFGMESHDCRPALDLQGNCTAPAAVADFPTSSRWYSIGARWRIPVGTTEPYVQLAYGGHSFGTTVAAGDEPEFAMPDVSYGFLRLGGGARLPLGPLVVEPRLAYLFVLGLGDFESSDWFPGASGGAIEAMLRVGFPLSEALEVQAAFNYQAYGLSMNVEPGGNADRAAGSASDRYLSGSLGVEYKIPASR